MKNFKLSTWLAIAILFVSSKNDWALGRCFQINTHDFQICLKDLPQVSLEPDPIMLGCEVIDCCPSCPGPPYLIEWEVKIVNPVFESFALVPEGLLTPIEKVKLRGFELIAGQFHLAGKRGLIAGLSYKRPGRSGGLKPVPFFRRGLRPGTYRIEITQRVMNSSTIVRQDLLQYTVTSCEATPEEKKNTFEQSCSGAIERTVQDKLSEFVSVLDFIPVAEHPAIKAGTSTFDATGSFQSALDCGRPVFVPAGKFKIDRSLSRITSGAISLIGEPGAIIDGSGSDAEILIQLGGNRFVESTVLSADAGKGSRTITFTMPLSWSAAADAPTLSEGDIILVRDPTAPFDPSLYLYTPPGEPQGHKGEMAEVKSVSGTTVTLKSRLYDQYTAGTTLIYKLNMPRVRIAGIEIRGNPDGDPEAAGLLIQYTRDLDLSNTKVTGIRARGLWTDYTFNGVVSANYVSLPWTYPDVDPSTAPHTYGLMISTGQNVTVRDNRLFGGWSGLDLGGWEPNRNIIITGNTIDSYPIGGSAIGTHGNAEFVTISNNSILNGVKITNRNIIVANNTIFAPSLVGILCYLGYDSDYFKITGNVINGMKGINLNVHKGDITFNSVEIADNFVRTEQEGIWIQPQDKNAPDFVINHLLLNNNDVVADNNQALFVGRKLEPDNIMTEMRVENLDITGGSYKATGYNAARLEVAQPTEAQERNDLMISGVRFITGQIGGSALSVGYYSPDEQSLNSFSHGMITGCLLQGPTSSAGDPQGGDNDIRATEILRFTNNTLRNWDSYQGLRLEETPTVILADNLFDNCNGSIRIGSQISDTFASKVLEHIVSFGQVIGRGSAVPTTGTWAVGDIIYNLAPAVDGYVGWVCIAAGSPGTWRPFGKIE